MVLPFVNHTRNKDYDFLSKDLAVFVLSELNALGTVVVFSNEMETPSNLDPTRKYFFICQEDFRRELVVSSMEERTNVIQAKLDQSDYVVKGRFDPSPIKGDDETWVFGIILSNTVSHSVRCSYKERFPYKRILDYQSELTEKLKRSLNGGQGFVLEVTSSEERTEVYLGDQYMGYAPVKIFLPFMTNSISLKKEGYASTKHVYVLEQGKYQSLSLDVVMEKDFSSRTFSLMTHPSGQRVYLNERYIGLSPVRNFSTYFSQAILYVSSSNHNYNHEYVKADFNRNSIYHISMRQEKKEKSFLSNRRLAWGSFWLGSAVLAGSIYYFMDAAYYSKLSALRQASDPRWEADRIRGQESFSTGFFIALSSIPCYAGTLFFTIRMSDEKDW